MKIPLSPVFQTWCKEYERTTGRLAFVVKRFDNGRFHTKDLETRMVSKWTRNQMIEATDRLRMRPTKTIANTLF